MIWYNHKSSISKFIFGGKMETLRLSSNWLLCISGIFLSMALDFYSKFTIHHKSTIFMQLREVKGHQNNKGMLSRFELKHCLCLYNCYCTFVRVLNLKKAKDSTVFARLFLQRLDNNSSTV